MKYHLLAVVRGELKPILLTCVTSPVSILGTFLPVQAIHILNWPSNAVLFISYVIALDRKQDVHAVNPCVRTTEPLHNDAHRRKKITVLHNAFKTRTENIQPIVSILKIPVSQCMRVDKQIRILYNALNM